jgi:hypothetical protein
MADRWQARLLRPKRTNQQGHVDKINRLDCGLRTNDGWWYNRSPPALVDIASTCLFFDQTAWPDSR